MDFITLITHSTPSTDGSPNSADSIEATVALAQRAGMVPNYLLLGLAFYARFVTLAFVHSLMLNTHRQIPDAIHTVLPRRFVRSLWSGKHQHLRRVWIRYWHVPVLFDR